MMVDTVLEELKEKWHSSQAFMKLRFDTLKTIWDKL